MWDIVLKYNREHIHDIIGWDTATWSKALCAWDEVIPDLANALAALELGAGRGGLSIYLALHGCRVVCSDVESPELLAKPIHQQHRFGEQISYRAVDATSIPYADSSFDVVAFKSLLGGIGGHRGQEFIGQSVSEIHRILRPGGFLLFAENLVGSSIHMYMRRRFVKWGQSWHYLSHDEIEILLRPFSRRRVETAGFLSAFGRSELQRSFLYMVDKLINPVIPDSQHYLVYGWAQK